jgi:hypothetical protein
LTTPVGDTNAGSSIIPSDGIVKLGNPSAEPVSAYYGAFSGPLSYGTGSFTEFIFESGTYKTQSYYIFGSTMSFNVSPDYIQGSPLPGSAVLTGRTLSSLGLNSTSGLLGTWTIGSDSIEVWAGAKPASAPVPAPLPLMGAGTAFAFSRRLRARLHRARRYLEA